MAAVYSTRFLEVSTSSNETVDYTVPSGFVAIVRDITAYVPGSGAEAVQVYLQSPQALLLDEASGSEGARIAQWTGRQVLAAGDVLECLVLTSGLVTLLASGYLLTV